MLLKRQGTFAANYLQNVLRYAVTTFAAQTKDTDSFYLNKTAVV